MDRSQPASERAGSRVSPTAPVERSASANVWRLLENQPGFNERVERGNRQLAEGRSTPFREVRRRR